LNRDETPGEVRYFVVYSDCFANRAGFIGDGVVEVNSAPLNGATNHLLQVDPPIEFDFPVYHCHNSMIDPLKSIETYNKVVEFLRS